MAQDNYYSIVNDEVCCQLHVLLHDNTRPLYTERQQQHQELQQQHQDLYIQQKTTPRIFNLFSPIQEDVNDINPRPPPTLDITAGDRVLYTYSTITSSSTTLASASSSDRYQQQHRFETGGDASLMASVLCPPLDIPTITQTTSSSPQTSCPNVIYSYDRASKSFTTIVRDSLQNIFLPGPNATWEELHQVTSSYSSDNISVLCAPHGKTMGLDIGGTSSGIFVNSILNNTYSAVTSTDTYISNVSTLLQNMHNLSEVNFSIVSKDDYLQMYLGKRYLSNAAMVALMAIYSLIFFTGVIGNVCTCLVIARNRFLHTATNYYLFSLAISDVLTLLLGK